MDANISVQDQPIEDSLSNLNLEEEINARHKKEQKELHCKIQALKKSAGKGDKKKKKEIIEQIAQLEIDIDKRHVEELENFNKVKKLSNNNSKNCDDSNNNISDTQPSNEQRISKAQKRRDKKAQEEKDRQIEYLKQEELNKNGPRMMETKAIKELLKSRQLQIHPISSDGDCLYNAIIHQLLITNRPTIDTQTLRNLTADYILNNKEQLIFYMTNPDTGNCLTDEEFQKYCDDVRNTPAWGGQIEIKALSNVLNTPIEVLQATGPPTIQNEGNFIGPNLTIIYHRLMFSLGEHYNSTKHMDIDDYNSSGEEIQIK